MPILPFEQARRKAVKHLEMYIVLPAKDGRSKPIGEKSALFRAMQKWEDFFPGRCLPVHELFWWLDLVDQSRIRDPIAYTTARTLLEIMKGPYSDPTLPAKEGDPWCHIDLKAKTVSIAGKTTPINHRPTLMILAELAKASREKPISASKMKHLPGCGHARQIGRFLDDHLPTSIRKLVKFAPGAGGGRWLEPPFPQ
jgi:hypothetical protein